MLRAARRSQWSTTALKGLLHYNLQLIGNALNDGINFHEDPCGYRLRPRDRDLSTISDRQATHQSEEEAFRLHSMSAEILLAIGWDKFIHERKVTRCHS